MHLCTETSFLKKKCNFKLLYLQLIYCPVTDVMIWNSNKYTAVLHVCYFVIFRKLYLSINCALFNTMYTADCNTNRFCFYVFYSMHFNTICWEAVGRSHQILRGILGAKKVTNHCCTARRCPSAWLNAGPVALSASKKLTRGAGGLLYCCVCQCGKVHCAQPVSCVALLLCLPVC